MRPGSLYLAFLILLLLLVGCNRDRHSSSEKTNPQNIQEKSKSFPVRKDLHDPAWSRFQVDANNDATHAEHSLVSHDTFVYYRPSGGIARVNSFQGKEIKIRKSRLQKKNSSVQTTFRPDEIIFSYSQTSPDIFFVAVFDNDIFDYTDYYYTNGIKLEVYHPLIGASPFARILPGLKNSINYFSLNLVQNLYTPLKLEELEARVGDRPFASYLSVGHQKISLSPEKKRRMQSELAIGVIGPASFGNLSQDLIHSHEPVGWVNQISNDFIINYNFSFEQAIYSGKGFDAAIIAGGQAGSLYDNVLAGIYLQAGRSNDRYGSVFQTTGHQKPFKRRVRYYFGLDLKNKLVVYDATLQGGMFNHDNVYKIEPDLVKRYVFTGTVFFGLGLGRYSLEAEQVYLSPEFEGGRRHLWFRIKNIIHLN